MKLHIGIKIGLLMIAYSSLFLGGHVEGNLRLGGLLYQWGLEFPTFILWIFSIIDLIAIWFIFHQIGSLWGIFFGGTLLYVAAKTGNPSSIMALGFFYGVCLCIIMIINFGFFEHSDD